ncbi:hypothetical protein GCM10011392_01240 [Wenxinia marina]|nr:hypothetical protein GCM10011392_01240 [Wenxinia marina]
MSVVSERAANYHPNARPGLEPGPRSTERPAAVAVHRPCAPARRGPGSGPGRDIPGPTGRAAQPVTARRHAPRRATIGCTSPHGATSGAP